MERAEKIGLGVAAVGHLALFGLLSLNLIWLDDKPKLGDPTVEITIAGDPGTAELKSDSIQPISQPEPETELAEEKPIEEFTAAEPETTAPPPDISEPSPDRSAELKRQREAEARKKRERNEKLRREKAAKDKAARDKARKARQEALRKAAANAANAANSGPPAKNAGQVRGEVNITLARQIKPFTRGCSPSGVDVKIIRTTVILGIARNGKLTGIKSASQSRVNENNRLQAAPLKKCILDAINSASPFSGLDPEYFDVWKSHKMTFVG